MQGSEIPLNARLRHMALKADACHTAYGRDAAETMARERNGKIFDPHVVDVFLSVAREANLWETLAKGDLWDVVLDLEPDSPYRHIGETQWTMWHRAPRILWI
jgi:hypothetical protein